MKQNLNKKGFTLIELLVVIAIIGILAAITVVSVSGPRNKATDTKRLSELRQVASVMEQYWGDKTNYNSSGAAITAWTGAASLETMLSYLGTPLPTSGDTSQTYKVGSCVGTATTINTSLGTGTAAAGYVLYVESKADTANYIYCKQGANCGTKATTAVCP
jgi:prepilin-type N-terminal cleavage/methylation domain-containing protein